jgi:hypothetical protein
MANDENLKSFKKGVSGNPAGRPKGPKTNEQNVADLRDLLDLRIDDDLASILPLTDTKPEFLAKVKREQWSLEKLMDFFAIMGAIGGQSSYSYYREIKDRVYGKSDMVSGESRPGNKSALDRLTPIKAKAKTTKIKKEEYDDTAEILAILNEVRSIEVPEDTEELGTEDESNNAGIIVEVREQDGDASRETESISSIK